MKKKITFIMALAMIFNNGVCFAQSGVGMCGVDMMWTLSDSTLSIEGTGVMWNISSGSAWFQHANYIKTIKIEEGVTEVGNFAFYQLPNLVSVKLSNSVKKIRQNAFEACPKLTSINLDSVKIIEKSVFLNCKNLNIPHLDASSLEVGQQAFSGCKKLKSITVTNNTYAKEDAFSDSGITEVHFSPDLTKIPDNILTGCTQLTSVNIPEGVTDIGYLAFAWTSITSIRFPPNLQSIGMGAFAGSKLISVTVPYSVTRLEGTFMGCTDLISVTLSDNWILFMGSFLSCGLKSITIPCGGLFHSSPKSTLVISGDSLETVNLMAKVSIIHDNTIYGLRLKNINVEESNPYFCSENGILFDKDKTILMAYPSGKTNHSYTVPSTVKWIASDAFQTVQLSYLTIPASVTSFGSMRSGIDTIEMERRMPPIVGNFFYDGVSWDKKTADLSDKVLVVPDGSVPLYRDVIPWSLFGTVIEKSSLVSNENISKAANFRIFPNPADDYLVVECEDSFTGKELKIFGVNGVLTDRRIITETQTRIDISGYPKGIYVINIDGKAVKAVKK